MRAQAYEGYFENGQFYSAGLTKPIKGRRKAFITILDEIEIVNSETEDAKAWREFFEAANENDEKIPEAFAKVNFNREVEI